MVEEIELQSFGLTATEAKVYLSLLRLGSTTTGPLIRKTELHRATVYDVLKRLMEKGLANYIIKGKTKHFEASSPERFLDMIADEKAKIEMRERHARQLADKLSKINEQSQKKEEAHIYVGKKSVKMIFEEALQSGDYVSFGSMGRFWEVMGEWYKQYQKMKKRLGIKSRVIVGKSFERKEMVFGKVRCLPDEFSSPNTSTLVYGSKVAIIIWLDQPVVFVIESEEMAETYGKYFDLLWKIAK